MCKAEVIISDEPIGFTKVVKPTFLMALTQKALDEYGKNLSADCLVLADTSLEIPEHIKKQTIAAPILETAVRKTGKPFVANIVAVGVINTLLGIVNEQELETAVFRHIPAGTEELNKKALAAGVELGAACLAEQKGSVA